MSSSRTPNGAASALPPLYGGLVPLNHAQHAKLRVRDVGFAFAAGMPAVPLALEEFSFAARHMGVVFATQPPHMPLAILGGGPATNLFISADGRWKEGAYVPAYLRRYPFLLVRVSPDTDELALCLDPAAPHFSDTEGEALFAADGKPTPMATRAFEFTRAVEGSFMRTQEFVAALSDLKLLAPAAVQFERDGKPMRVDGFHAIQREAYMALSGEQLAMLRDKGWLEAIHAHLFSVAALPSIVQQQAAA